MTYLEQEFKKRLVAISNTNANVRVVGHLLSMPQISASSSWQQGMIAKLINMFTNAGNLIEKFKDNPDAIIRSSGLQEWQGSDPMTFSVEMLFHFEQPSFGGRTYTGPQLNQNVNELMKLVLPSGFDDSGIALKAPAGFAITRVKDGDFSFVTQLNEIINGTGYVTGANSLTISQNGKLVMKIPNFLIVNSITPRYGEQMESTGGYRWIKCTVELSTLFAPTADKFAEWFNNGTEVITGTALGKFE